jgi:probable phosphomutase (TIGR03848 family)
VTTVLLVRHGRTSANTAGVLAGRSSGVELDEVGRTQVKAVGERLAKVPLVAVVSSPLRRCRQTSQALLAARDDSLDVTVEQGVTECGYGDWTGKALRDLAKEDLWKTVQTHPSHVRFPNGESMTEMSARAVQAVRRWDAQIAAEHGDHAVWAVVSHGDPIKAILADALGLHLDQFQRIMVDPASLSIIRYTATRPYVVTTNSTNADLGALLSPPPKDASRSEDAAVGGGLGSAGEAAAPAAATAAPAPEGGATAPAEPA